MHAPPPISVGQIIVRGGLPRPVTQIPVADELGRVRRRIDMGWPNDIVRLESLAARGWTIVRVSARQLQFRQHESSLGCTTP
ncbi:hypothetical protein [Mycolicibacterium fortuitum]|uniref:hypothetical protein n=1 Tax=Mycolicibacterium fortuitum TaxID=1766 RepID=UPI003557CE6F